MNIDWFSRIMLFNKRPFLRNNNEENENSLISKEFFDILQKCNIQVQTLTYQSDNIFYVWCSNFDEYKNNLSKPVLYIDAHYDVIWKDMILPLKLGDVAIASCHDNRASCNILCYMIEQKIYESRNNDFITYITFSDCEERGMNGITSWFDKSYIKHDYEKFIVLDVSSDFCLEYRQSNLGNGVYCFSGDPIEQYINDLITQQPALHKQTYPDNLRCTHASIIFSRGFDVSRMGIPVAAIANTFSGDLSTPLHVSHTAISLSDLNNYYLKLCSVIRNFQFNK